MCVSSHVCLKLRVSQPTFSFLPESRNWVLLPATAHTQSGDAAGPGTRTWGCGPRLFPAACAASQWTERWQGAEVLLLDSILEGFAWWLSACPQRPSVQSLQCHGLTPPGKTEQPLPKLAALLINTRKHNLRVLRAGPKSTVSWESGHVGGTRDAPPGAGHAASGKLLSVTFFSLRVGQRTGWSCVYQPDRPPARSQT